MYDGAKPTATAEFDIFASTVTHAILPRWERKALEKSQRTNLVQSPRSSLRLSPQLSKSSATPKKSEKSASRGRKTPRSVARSGRKKTPGGCRFIPNRAAIDIDVARSRLRFEDEKVGGDAGGDGETDVWKEALAGGLLNMRNGEAGNSKILAFKSKAPVPKDNLHAMGAKVLYNGGAAGTRIRKKFRHIPSAPEKILDAPDLLNDYYVNLLSWSQDNVLAVGLGAKVYVWSAATGKIDELCDLGTDAVTSVEWMPGRSILSVGTGGCEVQLWDVERMAMKRNMKSHTGRVGALSWNGPILSSGSRDSTIHNHDVRIPGHHVSTLAAHTQEVCGLKWSPNGTQLASGGNDNLLAIWDQQQQSVWSPSHELRQHTAAVKALAWCPWQTNLLATGGGAADRHLRFWNTQTGACLNSVDTNSQVCSVLWSPHAKELVTGHGYSQNQLTVWKYPTLSRMAELKGHTSRVLHLALSPDGQTVCSAAADETVRFWKVFASENSTSRRARSKGTLSSSKLSRKGLIR